MLTVLLVFLGIAVVLSISIAVVRSGRSVDEELPKISSFKSKKIKSKSAHNSLGASSGLSGYPDSSFTNSIADIGDSGSDWGGDCSDGGGDCGGD